MANKDIINALFVRAAKEENWDEVKRLLEQVDNINTVDEEGNTALIWAVRHGNYEIAELLIGCRAIPHWVDANGKNALMWAAGNGDLPLVQLMLKAIGKEGVDERDNDGNTALMWAAMCDNDNVEVVNYLIKNGANENAKNRHLYSVLMIAMNKGNKGIVAYLVSIGARA